MRANNNYKRKVREKIISHWCDAKNPPPIEGSYLVTVEEVGEDGTGIEDERFVRECEYTIGTHWGRDYEHPRGMYRVVAWMELPPVFTADIEDREDKG